VLSLKLQSMVVSVFVGIEAVNVMAAYQPVCAGVQFTVEAGTASTKHRTAPR
jgi:hypothetical protein